MTDTTPTDGVVRPHPAEAGRSDAYLPAPTVQTHAANLMTLPTGDLACVWFGGTQEGVADINVWMSTLPAGGDTWTAPVQLSDDGTRSEQNPVLFPTPAGDLWLLWTAQRAGHQDTSEVRRRISTDSGHSWGRTETLFPATETGGVFVRQPVTVLPSGRWLLPVFHCVSVPGSSWVGDKDTSAVLISDDQGRTWQETAVPDSTGCVHMNIHPVADGTLLALYRSRWADNIYQSWSTDDGQTWSAPARTELPNNNSSIQYATLADGRLALVYNNSSAADATDRRLSLYDEIDDAGLAPTSPAPTSATDTPGKPVTTTADCADSRTAFWGAPRAPMTLAMSADGGDSWPLRRDIEQGDGYCLTNNSRDGLNRELSYPSIHQGLDGALHVAYTHFRKAIRYVRIDPKWVDGDDRANTS